MAMSRSMIISQATIESKILTIRGRYVMLDRDLAELYGVETKYLNRQVRRNKARFPAPFVFRLTAAEKEELVTKCHRFKSLKHSSSSPYAFTENGVLMLSNVLKSKTAIDVSIAIVVTLNKLKELVLKHKGIALKLKEIEKKLEGHDVAIRKLFEYVKQILIQEDEPKREIGFNAD